MNEKKTIIQSDPYKRPINKENEVKNVYWGEVLSVDDPTDGGRIKVRIPDLDNKLNNPENLPYAYPLLPKYFHVYPQVGEIVRIIVEDMRFPMRSRFWIGSVISQPQKIGFDDKFTAFSTTNLAVTSPEEAPSTIPNAEGVFPLIDEIAIVGRENTDIILREREVEIRAGKHEFDNVLALNKLNPASFKLTYEQNTGDTNTTSTAMAMADKILLISHDGNPKFPATNIDQQQRANIFEQAHPLGRADVIVEALEIIRKAIQQHVHPYDKVSADVSGIMKDLESIDFSGILQPNILIN